MNVLDCVQTDQTTKRIAADRVYTDQTDEEYFLEMQKGNDCVNDQPFIKNVTNAKRRIEKYIGMNTTNSRVQTDCKGNVYTTGSGQFTPESNYRNTDTKETLENEGLELCTLQLILLQAMYQNSTQNAPILDNSEQRNSIRGSSNSKFQRNVDALCSEFKDVSSILKVRRNIPNPSGLVCFFLP